MKQVTRECINRVNINIRWIMITIMWLPNRVQFPLCILIKTACGCIAKFPFGKCWQRHQYSTSQEICTRFLLCCALLWLYIDWFSHIHQAYFTGTVANLMIAPVPAKQPWWIWINTSCEFIMNDCITTTKQSTTEPCAYFLGYTVRYAIAAS